MTVAIITEGESAIGAASAVRLATAGAKAAATPWARAGRPEEVADLVAFLLSDAADSIIGTRVTIDGALSLTIAQGA